MVSLQEVENQLKQIGTSFRYWGRSEMLELRNILIPGEQIQVCVNGRWMGGFAMLCATDQRVLLVDKKPLYLTIEDVRYDMVTEVDYSYRLLNASVRICTPNKTLAFMGFNHSRMRTMTNYIQRRVMEIRQQHIFQQTLQRQQESTPLSEERIMMGALRPVATGDGTDFISFPQSDATPLSYFRRPTNPYTSNPLMMRRRVAGFRR